jgi:tRNA modification GTPase
MDTIFALASARGKAGVAIVRLSGPRAHEAVRLLAGDVPAPRRASLRNLRWDDDLLDQALVLTFSEGEGFTGEIAAELHLHGSPAVTTVVLRALGAIEGLRGAEPGEFTRRALSNGKLDLTQVEGLADLIEAETEAQRRQALRVFNGAIADRIERWRYDLVRAAALLEATIDFVDEDVPIDVRPEVLALVGGLIDELRREAAGVSGAELIRDGFEVAIVGRPNTGKSTLLNLLAGRDAAITSEVEGTTRDVIEVRMDLGGLAVTLLDTAGLRETDDRLEQIGVERAIDRARAADLRIFLTDERGLPEELQPLSQDIVVAGKADIHGHRGVSGKTGEGVAQLVQRVTDAISQRVASAGVMTRERHRTAARTAIGALEQTQIQLSGDNPQVEFAADSLRLAMRALDTLVGRIDVESLLGVIFASFCIGK